MLTFVMSVYVLVLYLLLTLYYIRNGNKEYDQKFVIFGWLTFVLPVIALCVMEIVGYVWLR